MAYSATVSLTSTNFISLSGVSPFELTIDPKHINVPNKIRRIEYDFDDDVLEIDYYLYSQHFGQVYFSSKAIAQKAKDTFKDDLLRYYTRRD